MSRPTGLVPDLAGALRLFDAAEADQAAVVASYERVCRDAALTAWVTTVAERLRAAMGEPSPGPTLPARPLLAGSAAKEAPREADSLLKAQEAAVAYLPVLAFAAALPDLVAHHEALGVPADVTALTLADVGRMLERNRRWFGKAGLGDELGGWLTRHLHGALFQVGRLQYERVRLGQGTGLELRMAGFPCGPGDLALSLHIPEAGGALTPGAVDESVAAAKAFFRRRFPAEHHAALVCHSWLLDPQLLDVLPDGSNLAAFQRRFTLGGGHEGEGDDSVRKFVFGDVTTPVGDLPRDSSLRRAVVRHWQRGGHWQVRRGWIAWR